MMRLKKIYDYMIIGGGVAGTVCGKLLSESGAECLIIEKEDAPFEKICGGWMPYKCLQLLRTSGYCIESLTEAGTAVTNGVYVSRNGYETHFPYRNGEFGIGLRRKLLHSYLMDEASKAGCAVKYSCCADNITHVRDMYCVNENLAHKVIMAIGTGKAGYLKGGHLTKGQSIGISEIIIADTCLKKDHVYFWYPDQSNSYFWAIPIEMDVWNIGWWTQSNEKVKDNFQLNRSRYIEQYFSAITTLRKAIGALCGNTDHRKWFDSKIYGIGDFAGCNSFETGEGIYNAILSAKQLAEILIKKGEN